MTTEREMDERVKKGFSVVNQKTCLKTRYTTIAITNETMDKLKTLKDKVDREEKYVTNDKIINLALNAYESILNRPDDNIPLELGYDRMNGIHNNRKTTEWKVSKDRKTIVRYVICENCRHIFSKETKEISPDMREIEDNRIIEYLTTPVRVE